jgi:hypothetical protein
MGAKNRRFSIGLSSMPPGDACRTSYPVAPLDRADKDNLSLRRVDCAGNRRIVRQSERERGRGAERQEPPTRRTNLMICKEGVRCDYAGISGIWNTALPSTVRILSCGRRDRRCGLGDSIFLHIASRRRSSKFLDRAPTDASRSER